MTVSIPGAGVETPQLRSSDISPQSLSPSQIQRAGIQRPLSHWNWPGPHVAATNSKHDYFSVCTRFQQRRDSLCALETTECSLKINTADVLKVETHSDSVYPQGQF